MDGDSQLCTGGDTSWHTAVGGRGTSQDSQLGRLEAHLAAAGCGGWDLIYRQPAAEGRDTSGSTGQGHIWEQPAAWGRLCCPPPLHAVCGEAGCGAGGLSGGAQLGGDRSWGGRELLEKERGDGNRGDGNGGDWNEGTGVGGWDLEDVS